MAHSLLGNYLLIFEDGSIVTTTVIEPALVKDCDNGLITIIDIGCPDSPEIWGTVAGVGGFEIIETV